jgi:hypothetical protein
VGAAVDAQDGAGAHPDTAAVAAAADKAEDARVDLDGAAPVEGGVEVRGASYPLPTERQKVAR